jgi:signal transduction histidine kinase/CheY-like chemotaxis protein
MSANNKGKESWIDLEPVAADRRVIHPLTTPILLASCGFALLLRDVGFWRPAAGLSMALDALTVTVCLGAAILLLLARQSRPIPSPADRNELARLLALSNHELELCRERLERTKQQMNHFLRSMNHALRTPLSAVVGFSELLAENCAGALPGKQRRFVERIRTGATRLEHLSDEILELARLEDGTLNLQKENVDLAEVLLDVVSSLGAVAAAKQITVMHKVTGVTVLFADRKRVAQILRNMLMNALASTPRTGEVKVECTADDSCVHVSVQDGGPGIHPSARAFLFDEFRPVGRADLGAEDCSGLELALSKRLVEQHGGQLWLESGRGNRFTFSLPVGDSLSADRVPSANFSAANGRPLVLVVDDEPSARELLSSYLESAGLHFACAASSAEAVERARRLLPDAITLDITMPGGSGLGALFELRSMAETSSIPILVVSGADQRELALGLGAATYLGKPVSRGVFLEAVQHACALAESTARTLRVT